MPIIKLRSFRARISTQGLDFHLHIPRSIHDDILELKLTEKKRKYTILVEDS